MSVISAASEMAGLVISSMARVRSITEDAGIKRALLNYIMAFPVALKVSRFRVTLFLFYLANSLAIYSAQDRISFISLLELLSFEFEFLLVSSS